MANITTANNFSEQKQESTVQVKKEKKDDTEASQSSSGEISNIIVNNPQLSQLQARNVTITVAVNTSSSSGQSEAVEYSKSSAPSQSKPATASAASKKAEEPPPIDFPSICGSFGWTTIGTVHLPFIMRGEDRFVAVRMVESKIISKYADILPWTVFTCTNIKSYYITENEAKLFNEINGYHCEFQFGYQTFSAKDVVVRLGDTVKFYEFLETCRTKLHPHGGHPAFKDKCGFIMVNCTAVPYLSKGSNKYVPLNMVYPEGVSAPVPATEKVSEWDLAYLRFLCFVANLDQRKLKAGIALCCLEDLQNALGLCFEEWWPSMPLSSKGSRTFLSSPSNGTLPKWGGPLQLMQTSSPHEDGSHNKLRDNVSEVPVREDVFNPFIKAERYGESNRQAQKSPHISQHDISNNVQNTASNGNHHLFPSSLEGLLAAPTPRDYSTFNYQAQYGHGQISAMGPNLGRSFSSEGGLSALATSRPRPFPPPPPLVRLRSSSRSNMVSSEHSVVPKPPVLYPYLQPSITPAACPPWLTRVLEPDWFHEDQNRMDPTHQPSESASLPDSLSRRLSGEHDQCGAINFATGGHIDGAGSSNFVQNNCGGGGRTFRENYDSNCNPGYREERVVPTHRGSPRLTNGPGPPPHYPTPPQSSPLQPPSVPVMDCGPITGLPDIYATRTTPNSVIDLCSPPPSPDTRTAISCSPRGSYVPGNGYHPHIVRLVLVDSRYVPAVNIEPHKHNSALAVPISDVVSKFLRGTTVQSCQVILETVFGLHLYECTSLHLEALAKHKVVVDPGSKLVTVPDLRNYLHQLRFLLAEREKRKDRSCDGHTETELPLGKRWCDNDRES